MTPRPTKDIDRRVFEVLARGGRWTAGKISGEAYASSGQVYRALERLRAQGLAYRYRRNTRGYAWVVIDPKGAKIKMRSTG